MSAIAADTDDLPFGVTIGQRPALILAGGGHKVAFQAGVLQVWLDEANLKFELADGTSAGTFNLAMWCQGMTGRQIADNWRGLRPMSGVSPNWRALLRGPFAESLLTFDRYRRNIFPNWGLDWNRIVASEKPATFNVYDFTRHELVPTTADQMSEDLLVACNSIPFWFPPVRIGDHTWVDAVYVMDANLEQAIADGADDLFVIWTVSRRGVWSDGLVAQYFQTIEEAAYGSFKRTCERIRANNRACRMEMPSEFHRPIALHVLEAEVPLNYIINLSTDRTAAAVELGVREARRWCAAHDIALEASAPTVAAPGYGLTFSEKMDGFFAFGCTAGPLDGHSGAIERAAADRGRQERNRLTLDLKVDIARVARFVIDSDRTATVSGQVDADAFGGRRRIDSGELNLFSHQADPGVAQMRYALRFHDAVGHPLTLIGVKRLVDDPGLDMWSDATTLFVNIYTGHRTLDFDDSQDLVASGVVSISPLAVLRQLLTLRSDAPHPSQKAEALLRFGQLFFGKMFDVYGQPVLAWSPI